MIVWQEPTYPTRRRRANAPAHSPALRFERTIREVARAGLDSYPASDTNPNRRGEMGSLAGHGTSALPAFIGSN